jgi:hypothetical protein
MAGRGPQPTIGETDCGDIRRRLTRHCHSDLSKCRRLRNRHYPIKCQTARNGRAKLGNGGQCGDVMLSPAISAAPIGRFFWTRPFYTDSFGADSPRRQASSDSELPNSEQLHRIERDCVNCTRTTPLQAYSGRSCGSCCPRRRGAHPAGMGLLSRTRRREIPSC